MNSLVRFGVFNKFVFRKIGDVFIKQVNPNSFNFIQAIAKNDLSRQVGALEKLGDMAPEYRQINEGTLLIKDIGEFSGSRWQAFKIWWKGSLRMNNFLNDIRPHNIGANGQIFDPALPTYQQWIYGGLGAALIAGAGYTAYLSYSTDDNSETGGP